LIREKETDVKDSEIAAAMSEISMDAAPDQRVEEFASIYSMATGSPVGSPLTSAQRRLAHTWYHENFRQVWPYLSRETAAHMSAVYSDMKSKAGALAQLACPTCGPVDLSFPIGIEPWSAQSSRNKVAIRKFVNAGLKGMPNRRDPLEGPVCLTVVSVVPRSRPGARKKDADNLVKGLLDALSGYLYTDDSAIQCLTTRRLEYSGAKGYYMVGVRRAIPFDADVIFDDPTAATLLFGDLGDAP
jgi:Holliday junction resolvase RusA-like endonuclease